MRESPIVLGVVAAVFIMTAAALGWDAAEQHRGRNYIFPPVLAGAFTLTVSAIVYWRFKNKKD